MKLTLVHPPFATLTAVPAGICLLKSYIKTHYPTHEVLTMDLNLEMFEWLHDLDFEERRTVVREMGDIEPLTCQEVEIQRKILRAGTHKNFSSENEINSVLSAQDNFLLKLSDALQTTVIYLLLQDKSPGEFRLFEFVVKRILSTQPDIVGISVFSNFQLAAALGLTAILRQKYNIPVMMGGPAMLDFDLNELMNVFSFIDYIILGEAEESLGKFLNAMSTNKNLKDIPGLVYRGRDNQIYYKEAALLKSLNNLPFPDYSDLPLKKYYNRELILPVQFSRGCFWKRCAFCALHHTFKDHYRIRPHTQLVQELEYLKEKWHCNLFYFIDLSISPKHIDIISQKLIDAKMDIKYCFFSRGSFQYTPELFAQLKESGCVYILWGVESGSQRILELMTKGVSPAETKINLQSSHEVGIKNYIFVLLGFPGEIAADRYETSLFIAQNYQYIDFVCTSIFVLDRNSWICKQQDKYKIKVGRSIPFIEKNNETVLSTHLFEFKELGGAPVENLSEYINKYYQLYWGPLFLGSRGGIYYEHLLSLFLDRTKVQCSSEENMEK